jgi:Beta-propeller repeat
MIKLSIQKKLGQIGLSIFSFLFFILIGTGFYFSSSSIGDKEILSSTSETHNLSKIEAIAQFLKAPLCFECNEGQTDANVKYLSKRQGYTFYFTPQEMVMVLQGKESSFSALRMQFIEANPNLMIKGMEKTQCKSNYFIGNDPQKWRTNISNYAKVCYQEMYSGIDVLFYGNNERLEYDICVAPGKNPQTARLKIEGAKELSIDPSGTLHILTDESTAVQMQKPFVYQVIDGNKIAIDGHFILLAQNEIGFSIGNYDSSQWLVIDPVLDYSTYLGGTNEDFANAIAIDSTGNVYVTGSTQSTNFPTTTGAFQTTLAGNVNTFITKLKPAGGGPSDLLYSTYLGGNNSDTGNGIAVDSSGNVYVVGFTQSTDFPTTIGAFQTTLAGSINPFITKLNPAGGGASDLLYSTYLGGSNFDIGNGIAVDSTGNVYVTGYTQSTNFPTTINAFQTVLRGTRDAFITKLKPVGSGLSDLLYSTYLGGNTSDAGLGIAIDSGDNAYVAGETSSTNFPTTTGAFQTTLGGARNGFITKINPASGGPSDLLYSTYLGGNNFDFGFGIAIDSGGNAYVTGLTQSTNFPTTTNAFQTTLSGTQNAFITKLNPVGGGVSDLLYSTYLGGNNSDAGLGIAIDSSDNAYVTGYTNSTNFPTTIDAFQMTLTGIQNAFITKLNLINGGVSDLLYSTYLGGNNSDTGSGIAIDSSGNAYVVGYTDSTSFPTTVGAFQAGLNGTENAFISKLTIVPFPPTHLQGFQTNNSFATQTDTINVLKWKAPLQSSNIFAYRIYRNRSLTKFVAEIPANKKLQFKDHNRKKGKTYTYYIVSVDQFGNMSVSAKLKIKK